MSTKIRSLLTLVVIGLSLSIIGCGKKEVVVEAPVIEQPVSKYETDKLNEALDILEIAFNTRMSNIEILKPTVKDVYTTNLENLPEVDKKSDSWIFGHYNDNKTLFTTAVISRVCDSYGDESLYNQSVSEYNNMTTAINELKRQFVTPVIEEQKALAEQEKIEAQEKLENETSKESEEFEEVDNVNEETTADNGDSTTEQSEFNVDDLFSEQQEEDKQKEEDTKKQLYFKLTRDIESLYSIYFKDNKIENLYKINSVDIKSMAEYYDQVYIGEYLLYDTIIRIKEMAQAEYIDFMEDYTMAELIEKRTLTAKELAKWKEFIQYEGSTQLKELDTYLIGRLNYVHKINNKNGEIATKAFECTTNQELDTVRGLASKEIIDEELKLFNEKKIPDTAYANYDTVDKIMNTPYLKYITYGKSKEFGRSLKDILMVPILKSVTVGDNWEKQADGDYNTIYSSFILPYNNKLDIAINLNDKGIDDETSITDWLGVDVEFLKMRIEPSVSEKIQKVRR